MKLFSDLFEALDSTTKTNLKVSALEDYFHNEDPDNLPLALLFLFGERIPRVATPKELRAWISEVSNVPPWLIEESYAFVGDLAETISLLVPTNEFSVDRSLEQLVKEDMLPLLGQAEGVRKKKILELWSKSSYIETFLINKMLTGSLRVGVSKKLVLKALSNWKSISEEVIATRSVGKWNPTLAALDKLLDQGEGSNEIVPKPFCLASSLETELTELGLVEEWFVEWKWDGIRAQIVRNGDKVTIWSRGEEVINHSFPEIEKAALSLTDKDFILDGELLVWDFEKDLPAAFSELQKRLGRKIVSAKMILERPVRYIIYDLLYLGSRDLISESLGERRKLLDELLVNQDLKTDKFIPSKKIDFSKWEELKAVRSSAREMRAEGLVLKKLSAPYTFGRKRGNWWKWKLEPFTFDLVLLYAQSGHGRRAGLFTDFTLGVWDSEGRLVPLTKAYSGLTDLEMKKINSFVRKNTLEKFGPVVHVKPHYVFEISCEGIQKSSRHKVGWALRFPRITRIRDDKKPEDADRIEQVEAVYNSIY